MKGANEASGPSVALLRLTQLAIFFITWLLLARVICWILGRGVSEDAKKTQLLPEWNEKWRPHWWWKANQLSLTLLLFLRYKKIHLVEISRPKEKVGSKISNVQNLYHILSYPNLLTVCIFKKFYSFIYFLLSAFWHAPVQLTVDR